MPIWFQLNNKTLKRIEVIYISEASEIILGAVDEAIKRHNITAPFDCSIRGRVVTPIGNNLYRVIINGNEYDIPSSTANMEIKTGDQIWVTIPQNNWNNMFIASVAKANNISLEDSIKHDIYNHIGNLENPHKLTLKQLKIEKIDNTSDIDKPVSKAQQKALDIQLGIHTDCKIDNINGIHGVRYYNDILSYHDGTVWIEIATGTSDELNAEVIALRSILTDITNQLTLVEQKVNTTETMALETKKFAESLNDLVVQANLDSLDAKTNAQQALDLVNETINIAQSAETLAIEAKKLAEDVHYMIDPSTGKLLPLQEVLNNLYNPNANIFSSVTAGEYAALGLTASDYAKKRITAADYSIRSKQLLGG